MLKSALFQTLQSSQESWENIWVIEDYNIIRESKKGVTIFAKDKRIHGHL